MKLLNIIVLLEQDSIFGKATRVSTASERKKANDIAGKSPAECGKKKLSFFSSRTLREDFSAPGNLPAECG
jgi:hypothetical protein